jgi:ElaB/YqjD/DUF883 family membrane-anchored ribosome-binding protein
METNEIADKATEKARNFKQSAQEWTEKAKGKARDASAATDLYVHEYTWTTIALVAVASAALGFWLAKSND